MLVSNKKIIFLLTIIFCITITQVSALSPYQVTIDDYVEDYARLLNEDTKQYIRNYGQILQEKTGAQVVVVTVPNLSGIAIEEYATTIFRNAELGDIEKNNGVLLLLALEDRTFRIEVGYGLEGALNDAKTGRIQDQYIIPYLNENNWNQGIKNGYDAIIKEVAFEYNIEIDADNPSSKNKNIKEIMEYGLTFSLIYSSICALFIKGTGESLKKILFVIYIISIPVGLYLFKVNTNILPALSIINYIVFFMSYVTSRWNNGYSGSSYHSSSSSYSGSSSFGGGGSSGGGGSTRKF